MFNRNETALSDLHKNIRLYAVKKFTFEELETSLKTVLQLGIDINTIHGIGKVTALHCAVLFTRPNSENRMLPIIKLLIEAGGDVNKCSEDSKAYSPLHTSCRKALIETTKCLLDKHADYNIQDATEQTPLDYLDKVIISKRHRRDEQHRTDDSIANLDRLEEVAEMMRQSQGMGCVIF